MKFYSMLKKELREMLNFQTVLMLVFLLFVMYTMGGMVNSSMEESQEESSKVTICDRDDTEFTRAVINFIRHPVQGMEDNEVELVEITTDDYSAELDKLDGTKSFIIIPEGFTDAINSGETADLIYVSRMNSLATMSNINIGSETAKALIEAAVKTAIFSNKVQMGQLTEKEVEQLNLPINVKENTIVGDKCEEISQLVLYSSVYNQSLLMPLIVYMLILLGSQTMVNAVTAEKLDKTLETLLSAPVSRLTVISAKMLAATAVALLNAVVYMVGMGNLTMSVSGTLPDEYNKIIAELGLTFTAKHYILIGVQMLMSTLIALSISMIMGAFARTIKSSQTLIMPIMFVTIVPFMASMFVDISTLPGIIRYLLYAIPFTHTFMASDTVIFGNTGLYLGGLIYQIVFLMICMGIAIKIFTGDKIFTASEHSPFGKKKKKHND